MKCLIDARFNPALGGVSVYSRALIQAMLKFAPDVEFYLLVNREDDVEPRENIKGFFVYSALVNGFSRYIRDLELSNIPFYRRGEASVLSASPLGGWHQGRSTMNPCYCPYWYIYFF